MSKRTNLDIKDAACLHIVHNLQHPTSRPTTKSTQTTMVNAPKQNFSPLPAGRYGKSTKRSTLRRHHANEGKSGLERIEPEHLGHCAAWDPIEACGRETTRNALLTQWREREMDWGLCWERNRWGKKASWRRRGSGSARAGRYDACWDRAIDVQRAQKDIWGDAGCYWRQSVWSCKFRPWGAWGRWGWWIDWAGQAEQRWQTWLGDGHNHQNSTAAHGEVWAEADEARRIGSTEMGGCGGLLTWTRKEVQHIRIAGSGSRPAANKSWRSGSSMDNIWRAYGESRHLPRNIAKAPRDFSTRKCSYQARFGESAGKIERTKWWASCGAWFVNVAESEASWTSKLCWTSNHLPLHIASS